jgi:hypothetical protein
VLKAGSKVEEIIFAETCSMEEKKKMQAVAFRNMNDFLAYLPENQLVIVEKLREIIATCIPQAEEYLSFNVPFYRRYKSICFIWPGAVAWGSKTREGVEFGFSYGNLLEDAYHYLDKGNRKQVFTKRFYRLEDIKEDILQAYLLEAMEIDEMQVMAKRKTKK